MCGIAGFIADGGRIANAQILKRMTDRIAHRGPDGEGAFLDGSTALGHRRLSIIDIAGGVQPISNEDGSLQIVFNGEIYNFQELMNDLRARGHQFKTRSDTEVIVHLYEEAGETTPELLNGMFAFAIWNRRDRSLFLARDRFGEKPLYWSESVPGYRFAFASELKALRQLPDFDPKIAQESVAEFLNFGYISDPASIYEDVWKLEPGHSLLIQNGSSRKTCYWRAEFNPGTVTDFEPAARELDDLAGQATRMRMISDVPLGAFLSGGIDSSAVVAYMAQRSAEPVNSFSIGFTNQEWDETRFARLVASRYNTHHREEIVTSSIHDVLDTLVDHYDEPFGDSSAIPTLYLSRMTRQHVKVALSGDGADEVFGGYGRYQRGLAEERLRGFFPGWFRHSLVAAAGRIYPPLRSLPRPFRARNPLIALGGDLPEGYFTETSTFRHEALARILAPELRALGAAGAVRDRFTARFARHNHLPALMQMEAVDIETYLPGDILVKVDRASMAFSLETRAPWLDHRIQRLAGRLPPEFHLRDGVGKRILRQAVGPHLPPELLTRRKMGFGVPLGEWFRTSLAPIFRGVVLEGAMGRYIDIAEARRYFHEHQTRAQDHSSKLWMLLMLACWDARHYSSGRQAPGL